MWLIKLAWKNTWRNRLRTTITIAAIFFAVILSVITGSLQDGIFDNLVKNVVSFYSGYIQVHKAGYWDEQILDNSFRSDKADEQKMLQQKNVAAIASRLESFALVSSGNNTKGCMVIGIDPEKENEITLLKDKLTAGSYLASDDRTALLSAGLAQRLQVKAGDTIVLIGQGYHGATAAARYPIKGILTFGSPDLNEKLLFLPLATAQELYSAEAMITSYVLSLKNPDALEKTAESLRASMGSDREIMTWEDMMPDVNQHIRSDSSNMKIIQGILYLLICFGIFGTLLMMMVERKFEMGMLVAIGMKKITLSCLLLSESVITVLCGCILGIIVSIPIVLWLHVYPIRIGGRVAEVYERFGFEAVFPASAEPVHFISQGLIVLGIGLILSMYPMYKVVRLKPVIAMKK